jgi:hypothetical protein
LRCFLLYQSFYKRWECLEFLWGTIPGRHEILKVGCWDTWILAKICVSSTAAPMSFNCAAICSILAMKFIIDWSAHRGRSHTT